MSKVLNRTTKLLLLSLLIALLMMNTLILAPEVGAASDTQKTETELNTNQNISEADEDVLTQRAILMDEAKVEAEAVVSEQLAIIASEEEEERSQTPTDAAEESYDSDSDYEDSAEDSSSTSDYDYSGSSSVGGAVSGDYLMDIDNPDPNYVGYAVELTDYDRDMAERILMGEAGGTGFIGMALVAQTIRDTYVEGSYSSIAELLVSCGYYGSTSITPDATAKEVVEYIFDQGGSAVQHRLRYFYASDICYSAWHESQNYVCSYGYERFFDMY